MKNNFIYSVSKKSDGSMKENKKMHVSNLGNFLEQNNLNFQNAYFMKQVHGGDIAIVDSQSKNYIENVDGIVTREKNKTLAVFTADCVPVVVYDSKKNGVGAAHAGYKGILTGVVENLLKEIKKFGGTMDHMIMFIGPSIHGCCYNVPKERIEEFEKRFPKFENIYYKKNNVFFLRLDQIVLQIAVSHGIRKENITIDENCTSCSDDYFSYRKSTKENYGEFITTITLV